MESVTQTLLLAARRVIADDANEDTSARLAAFDVQVEEYRLRFHQFETLDEVFSEFLRTNHREYDGSTFDFDSLMRLSPSDGKIYTKYVHADVPYLATLFVYNGSDNQWVNIKLANNGFVYVTKEGRAVRHHQSPNYIALPWSRCLSYFPSLRRFIDGRFRSAAALYSCQENRLSIKLYATPPLRSMMVTFEPGFPYHEDDAEYQEAIPPVGVEV